MVRDALQPPTGSHGPFMASPKGRREDWLAALDDFRNWLVREAA
jgi:hypothetical protein